jgi:hypothetical protein
MHRTNRYSGFVAALLAGLGLACSDSTGPRKPQGSPREIEKLSGDGQSAVRGTDMASPLRVHVIGTDGQPFPGATVKWTSLDGLATMLPAQSTTNASGDAEALVTSVATVGPVSVSATVQNLTPVVFSLTGLDPCDAANAQRLFFDATKTGSLGPLDCRDQRNRLHDLFYFSLQSQDAVLVRLRSTSYDPMVTLYPPARWSIDVGPTGTHEVQLKAILAPGSYGFDALSNDPNMTGPYELALSKTTPSAESCEWVLMFADITSPQSLASTDCPWSTNRLADHFAVVMQAGEVITLTETSTGFAPLLALYQDTGLGYSREVASSNGTASGTATITFTSDSLALYLVYATSALEQQTGAYTLGFSSTIPAAARMAAQSTILSTALHRSLDTNVPALSFPQGALHR